jgi:hypothetical protein
MVPAVFRKDMSVNEMKIMLKDLGLRLQGRRVYSNSSNAPSSSTLRPLLLLVGFEKMNFRQPNCKADMISSEVSFQDATQPFLFVLELLQLGQVRLDVAVLEVIMSSLTPVSRSSLF